MRVLELAEQLGTSSGDVKTYLKTIGCICRGDMDEVSLHYAQQALKSMPALIIAKKEDKRKKEAARRQERSKKAVEQRAADKRTQDSERKRKEAEDKTDKKTQEQQRKEQKKAEHQRAHDEAARAQAQRDDAQKQKEDAVHAHAAERPHRDAAHTATKKGARPTLTPPKPGTRTAAAAAAAPPAALAPEPPAATPPPTSTPEGPLHARPSTRPTLTKATMAQMIKATPPPAPLKPAPALAVKKPAAPIAPAKHAKPGKPVKHTPAKAKPEKSLDMVPLDRIKKLSTREEEIKSALEMAQSQTLTKRVRVESRPEPRVEPRVEPPADDAQKKKLKPHFGGVDNIDDLINRPRLSSSAPLRQILADRAVATAKRAASMRQFRKRKHGVRPGQKPLQQQKGIVLDVPITVRDFSSETGVKVGDIVSTLMKHNIMATINQALDQETVELLALDLHLEISFAEAGETLEDFAFNEQREEQYDDADAPSRPPVVTFMGHVDHGKTSLLDAIRQTNVAGGESGGITQHIGAYEATGSFGTITFIDTPGHEAFTSMRARGARVTDIAVLVVAADDGLMPQSLEALDHAKAAGVPIMIAINKMDLPAANPDRIFSQLADRGLTPEDWGGETICCRVSAVTKDGLDHLLEMICLQAEVLELKARADVPASGVIIESVMDATKGTTVTLLVQEGTLRRGDALVCNTCFARARALLNYRSEAVEEAGPSMPVQVLGFSELPAPGSVFRVATSERHARDLVDERRVDEQRKRHVDTQKLTLESFHHRMATQAVKELPIIIKADTQGTTEALRGVVERIASGEVRITVLHTGAGDVSESDVMLASASNAIIVAFRVDVPESARTLAKNEGVDIQSYDVIYHVGEELQRALLGLLEPKFKDVETGVADVRQVFELSAGMVAGCHVVSGTIQRSNRVRVFRGEQQLFDGEIHSLRHIKDEVREMRAGFECGILLRDFKDVQAGDRIRAYKLERELPELPETQR